MASITKRGTEWRARVRRRGIPAQSKTFPTKAAAERWAREIEGQIDRGTFQPGTREAERVTLDEALERYSNEVSPKKRGMRQEQRRIARIRARTIAQRTLAGTQGTHLAKYRDERLAAGVGANSVRLELAIISHLYTIARKEWGMAGLGNPARDVELPSTIDTRRQRRLRAGEETRLLASAKKGPWWLPALIKFALATAMRRGELATLTWEQIDRDERIARLTRTKNGDARDVPLFDTAIDALDELPRSLTGLVFPANADTITHAFLAAARDAGCADLHLHDLRHEATSRIVESGLFNLVEVAAITGHKTLSMVKRYTHPRAADLAKRKGASGAL